MNVKLRITLAATLVAVAVGCATVMPINNVAPTPIVSNKQNLSLEDVDKAIRLAGSGLGWQMKTARPGLIVGTLILRTHTAVVDIPYDSKSYSIKYKDSVNLGYDDGKIHKNYNGWIENLDRGIKAQLTAI